MLKKLLACALVALAALSGTAALAAPEINKATAAELDGIKGIGPALSSRILEERKKGDFKNWADLSARVKGIGGKTAAKFSDQGLTVNGESFKGATAAAKPAKADKAATKG